MKKKIGIVGLGLIGGSIEKALLQDSDNYEVLSVSQSQGREYKLEDLKDCDIVFLCSSQSSIPGQLEQIAKIISRSSEEGKIPENERAFSKTIITDVASTEQQISNKAQELGLNNFIPGHQMAGTEQQGYEASFPELFENANWVLAESNSKTELLETIITRTLKAKLVIIDPETHDQSVAVISHLPLVLSLGLGELVTAVPQSKKIIGPGFKGMIRLAKGNPELGREMIALNRNNIKNAWELFKTEVEALLAITGPDLEKELVEIKEALAGVV